MASLQMAALLSAPCSPVAGDRVRVGSLRLAASSSTGRNGGALVVRSEANVSGGLGARGSNLITHAVAVSGRPGFDLCQTAS
jgi:hypothetical protein